MQRITDVKCHCSYCGWAGYVGDCKGDIDGDGSLGCPRCEKVVTVEMGNNDNLTSDELQKTINELKKLQPKDRVDVILSTSLPIGKEQYVRVEYKDRWYLIVDKRMIDKLKAQCQPTTSTMLTEYSPDLLMNIPIVENDVLVNEILSYHLERLFHFA